MATEEGAAASSPSSSSAPAAASGEHAVTAAAGPAAEGPERKEDWDPFGLLPREPTARCVRRVQRDVRQICRDPPPGCFVFPDEAQSTVLHCLLAGTADTPYQGGMFYFFVACPDDYPMVPPKVKILTGIGHCRFNPNLYRNGKVCLSILNTWSGPSWSPAHTIATLLMSIQSLMNDRPYHNEPGYEVEHYQGDVQAYNDVIRHETLRHAVLGMMSDLEQGRLPHHFRQVMEGMFLNLFEGYEEVCEENAHKDGQAFRDPFFENTGKFQYRAMLEALRRVKAALEERAAAAESGPA